MQFRPKKRPAVVSQFLIAFPLICMIASIALQGNSSLLGANSTNVICNANNLAAGQSCATGTITTTFTCPAIQQLFVVPCSLQNPQGQNLACPLSPPPPTYCSAVGAWLLPAGDTVTVQVAAGLQNSASGVVFGLGSIGPSGFIAIIGIVIGIVCLAGITIFGSGTGTESVHILFMGGLLMGLWIFLSGLDGFVSNNQNSMFTQLNAPFISLGGTALGTGFYIFLTMMYFVGFAGMVKRGV